MAMRKFSIDNCLVPQPELFNFCYRGITPALIAGETLREFQNLFLDRGKSCVTSQRQLLHDFPRSRPMSRTRSSGKQATSEGSASRRSARVGAGPVNAWDVIALGDRPHRPSPTPVRRTTPPSSSQKYGWWHSERSREDLRSGGLVEHVTDESVIRGAASDRCRGKAGEELLPVKGESRQERGLEKKRFVEMISTCH
jgi:hypothetical protein